MGLKKIKLLSGEFIPEIGYGTYLEKGVDCYNGVLEALKAGYRHIDTAAFYGNEEEVGKAIKNSGIDRKEIFVTTKVWIDQFIEGKAYDSVIESLRKLQLDYIDLILLHQPVGDYYAAYRDLEKLYKEGKVKAIGVSNFYPDRLVDLCLFSEIKPMVNQIEINIFHQRKEDKVWADKYGIVLEAWAPFAEGRNNMFHNETLMAIANKHHRSVAQVILRWLYQRGIVSLAKSIHEERIKENFDIDSFSLDEEDMNIISSMDKDNSSFFDHRDPKIVEWFESLLNK